jgi:hypothetical protein
MSNVIEMPKIKISGKVLQWEVINADGSIDQSCYRPSDNIITDVGLDMFASGVNSWTLWYAYFCIGTGTTEPATTDTRLTNETYRATCAYASYDTSTFSSAGSDPYYITLQRGVQTPLGALNGTYGEIGFSINATANSNILSKHLFKDELGNPTTITVSSAQQLRLKYILIFNLTPSSQITGTVNIDGIGNIGYTAGWQDTATMKTGIFPYILWFPSNNSNVNHMSLYRSDFSFGLIGATHYHRDDLANVTSTTISTYVAGSYERYKTGYWNVDKGNGTIYGLHVGYTNYANYAIKFDTPFTKLNTHALTFQVRISWGR